MMAIDEFLALLDGVKQLGPYKWTAHCPCTAKHKHGDANSSLSITLDPASGKILVYCHTGCAFEEICAELKIKPGDLSPDSIGVDKRKDFLNWYASQNELTLQSIYSYDYGEYSDGLAKVRFRKADGRKDFRWIRSDPNSKSGYKMTHDGCRHRLYFAGDPTASIVCVVEGEKDADRLHRLSGYTAVSAENGASVSQGGKWRDEYTEQLEGRSVYILWDNDEVGRRFAEIEAHALHGHAAHVFMLDLAGVWPDCPEKGDISDAADKLGDDAVKKILFDLMENTTEFAPIDTDKPKKRNFFVDLSQISDEDKTQFVWYPYLPTGEVTLLTADTKVGKGMLCALLAARLSSGLGLSDTEYVRCPEGKRAFPDDTPVGTIFLTREDGAKDIKPRFISSGGNENFLNVVDDTVLDEDGIPFTKKLNLAMDSGLTLLSDMIDAVNAKLIIIDPLADFSGGKNLNNREEVRELINGIRTEIARKKGVAVVIVHHTKKRGRGDSDYADMISGSHAFREVVRSVVAVEYDPEDPKAADNPKNTNWRIVMHLEGNRAIIGRTVRFYIGPDQEAVKNKINRVGGHFPVKGDDFETWSDVTPDIYKTAGLRGVSPGTIVRERREKQRIQDSTLDPLKQSVFKLAKTMREKGLSFAKKSYSEFEEENGGSAVWCGRTQNKALELLSGVFTANGISIKPGVKTDRGNERGFSISLSAENVS